MLSPAHRAFIRSYRMVTRAPFDLEPRINSLSIGSSRKSSSPGLGMSASTFGGSFEHTTTPRSYSDLMGGNHFGFGNRRNCESVPPEPFQFGKMGRSLGAASSVTRAASVLRPSRLSDAIGSRQDLSQSSQYGKSSQLYGTAAGTYANLTPPPSQDSLSASEGESAHRFNQVIPNLAPSTIYRSSAKAITFLLLFLCRFRFSVTAGKFILHCTCTTSRGHS